ncbi:pyridoxamine 5'-phosphate oxidase family protein [Amycolatopsis sp. cmx-11-32]|uniref:pyridoxamine 5'-phosphate oxidase family protein n=1 Tax=Amycolatopsis sp. cmx-11-32 TaxID=2785796 RepID=UPI0039E3B091
MLIATDVAEVLAEVRVLEMAIIGRDGSPQVRPMASAWVSESQQVVITTPVSYPQKAFDMRRNGRVALLYSDPVGSGLTNARTVLLQGVVSAPDVVATPQDLKEYWRELFRKNPNLVEEFADEGARSTMDWYYLRLPFFLLRKRCTSWRACLPGARSSLNRTSPLRWRCGSRTRCSGTRASRSRRLMPTDTRTSRAPRLKSPLWTVS